MSKTQTRREQLLEALSDLNDGTGDLGVIIDNGDPDATAEMIREVVMEAREEASIERDRLAILSALDEQDRRLVPVSEDVEGPTVLDREGRS